MHDDWQFADIISQRQTKHWNIGHVMARALTYTCKSSSSGDAVVWRHIKTIVEDREPYPVHRLAESETFWWYCYRWTLYCRAHAGYRICGQCFFYFLHVCFCFFFSSSHFCLDRPFGFSIHRGINSFQMPLFLPELLLKVVNPSGCSFLPKPPFRVFDLASIFIFHAFHSVFSFLPLTRPLLGREPAGNLYQNWYQCIFVHASDFTMSMVNFKTT